jgi:hypothetical protein
MNASEHPVVRLAHWIKERLAKPMKETKDKNPVRRIGNPLADLMLNPPKRRFRPNATERARLLLQGWKPRPVGRPKKSV